ncbi:MAG: type II toxin-antitoxin system HicB family antitoxin, partial [Candidatus Kariarchaeaceae archaeon]
DMIFPKEKYKDIDITEVEWAIDGLKQQFSDITIEFNYFIEKNQTDTVEIPLYSIEIFYSEKEECFIAFAPSFEYCFAKGDTREEALQKVEQVLDDLVRNYLSENIELPPLIEKYQDLEHDPKIK